MKKVQLRDRKTDGLCWEWGLFCGTMFLLGSFLLAGCDGQSTKNTATFCQWKFFNNIKIPGGDPQRVVASMSECQSICEASTACKGFDWSTTGGPDNQIQCFLLTTQDGKQPANNVLHYDKGYCADCLWYETSDYKIGGGTMNPATYLDACKNACLFTDNCQSIDWVNDGLLGQQCQLVSSRDNKVWAPGVTHSDFFCNTDCRWIRVDDAQMIGGTVNPANDIMACQNACLPRFGCKGIDWRSDQSVGQKCSLQFKQYGQSRAPGVTHFGLFCGTDCQWRRLDGWQIVGGFVNSAPDIVTCQNQCLTTPGCMGVDWAFYRNVGQKCYLLFKNDGKTRGSGVTHFDLFCYVGEF